MYEGYPKSFVAQFIIASNVLYFSLNILVGLHILFFYITFINFNSLTPARNGSIYGVLLSVWILYSQALLHFFSNPFITPKPFPMDGNSEGSKELQIWGSKTWAVWWMDKNSPSLPQEIQQHTSPYHAILTTPCTCPFKCIVPWRCCRKLDVQN